MGHCPLIRHHVYKSKLQTSLLFNGSTSEWTKVDINTLMAICDAYGYVLNDNVITSLYVTASETKPTCLANHKYNRMA